MEYLYRENIHAVVLGMNFRQRNPLIKDSESVAKYKQYRHKTRKDKPNGKNGYSSNKSILRREFTRCVRLNGHKIMYQGDHFKINNKCYMRFKSYLKNCHDCLL